MKVDVTGNEAEKLLNILLVKSRTTGTFEANLKLFFNTSEVI